MSFSLGIDGSKNTGTNKLYVQCEVLPNHKLLSKKPSIVQPSSTLAQSGHQCGVHQACRVHRASSEPDVVVEGVLACRQALA